MLDTAEIAVQTVAPVGILSGMATPSCPGYLTEPFATLVADYPDADIYPAKDFRIEWGPIFHRGRLDGSANVLILGQDPATHETITRRILVGEAGQRIQGLLAKIGIARSYVMINTFLYSVYGQGGGSRHAKDPTIAAYRNRWLDALLLHTAVTAVITLGELAKTAYQTWATTQPSQAERLHLAAIRHPTYPESSSRSGNQTLAEATAKLLSNWNTALPQLAVAVTPDIDGHQPPTPYGDTWQPGDLQPLPPGDLPAGSPSWWRDLDAWAARTGTDPDSKRATITVTVPRRARPWISNHH
jgi:uracil-DNA glycosylase